jgi:zinc transporter 1
MITLTSTFFLVEIVVGYITNSMALVADSFHMLSDVASLLVGYLALRYSKHGKQAGRYTFGWVRAEVLGALVNAVFLVALCFSIFVEALKRIIMIEEIDNPVLVLTVGGIGLFVNLIGLFLFHQHGHSHGGHGHSHGGGAIDEHAHGDGGHSHQLPSAMKKRTKKETETLSISDSMKGLYVVYTGSIAIT